MLRNVIERLDPSPLVIPKQPTDSNAQRVRERFNFVVEHLAVIVLDFGNCGSVELNAESGQSPRKSILR